MDYQRSKNPDPKIVQSGVVVYITLCDYYAMSENVRLGTLEQLTRIFMFVFGISMLCSIEEKCLSLYSSLNS